MHDDPCDRPDCAEQLRRGMEACHYAIRMEQLVYRIDLHLSNGEEEAATKVMAELVRLVKDTDLAGRAMAASARVERRDVQRLRVEGRLN